MISPPNAERRPRGSTGAARTCTSDDPTKVENDGTAPGDLGARFDADAVREALDVFLDLPGKVNVGAIKPRPAFRSFPTDDAGLDRALEHAGELHRAGVPGIYVRGSTVRPGLPPGRRGSDSDTVVLPAVTLDVDVRAPGAHVSTRLPATQEQALDALAEVGLPTPTEIESSGWGLYPRWRLVEPIADQDAAAQLIVAVHAVVARAWAARGWALDSTTDLARVWRVRGTVNAKVPEELRVCRVIERSGEVHTIGELEAAVAELGPAETRKPKRATRPRTRSGTLARLRPASAVHDSLWITTTLADLTRRVARPAAGDPPEFHKRLYAAAAVGYRAVDLELLTEGELDGRLDAVISRAWGATRDDDDQKWIDEGRRDATLEPWVLAAPATPTGEVGLGDLIGQLRTWLDMPDPTATIAALSVAATAAVEDGEPAWLLIVAAPSSGKTETTSMLPADEHLDEVTVAGLLSWTKQGKTPKPTGILTRLERGLVTFGDLSTLLASSDVGKRDVLFATLRRVYDGHLTRNVGSASGAPTDGVLSWHGRLTVVGAVTGAIDSYSSHAAALGSRWLYVRMPDRTISEKRAATRMARGSQLAERRRTARELADRVLADARRRVDEVELGDDVLDAIEDAAMACCYGRAAVPRHGYGAREIDGLPVVEEPPRLIRQLTTVARGAVALGCSEADAAGLVRSVALDSMPAARRAVLDVLAASEDAATTAGVARAAGLDRKVCRRTLEDLEAVGAARGHREGPEPAPYEDDRRPCTWTLGDEVGPIVLDVVAAHDRWEGWADFQVPNTPPPLRRRERGLEDEGAVCGSLNIGTPPERLEAVAGSAS